MPKIELEVIVDNRFLNLSRREADIALRPTGAAPEAMTGINIGPLNMTLYATAPLAAMVASGQPVGSLPWIGWEDGADTIRFGGFYRSRGLQPVFAYRSNSLLAQVSAAEAGLGVAVLPCFAGDSSGLLQRLEPVDPLFTTSLWILTHPDLRRAARIKAFIDFMSVALRKKRRLLAGSALTRRLFLAAAAQGLNGAVRPFGRIDGRADIDRHQSEAGKGQTQEGQAALH